MQRHLIPPRPYIPLPTGTRNYVPVLQDRRGEQTALRCASPSVWSQMTPLMEVVPRGNRFSHNAMKARMRVLKSVVGDHPIYLDLKKLAPCSPVQTIHGERPALEVLHEAARSRSLAFMPVAWTNSNEEHLKIVAGTNDLDGHGLALRHRMGTTVMPTGNKLQRVLTARLEALQIPASDIDLLIDLEYLDLDCEPSAKWTAALVDQSAGVGPWRSIVLIATSVPQSFGNGIVPEHSSRELPRREWALWNEVAKRSSIPVAFGDYAVQNPIPPLNPPPVGPWGNIRYSLEDALLVARGFDTRSYGPEQYVELSSWVISHASFYGAAFSYGDAEINRWATTPVTHSIATAGACIEDLEGEDIDARPASPGYWRGVGTSHHLELVTKQLRQLPGHRSDDSVSAPAGDHASTGPSELAHVGAMAQLP